MIGWIYKKTRHNTVLAGVAILIVTYLIANLVPWSAVIAVLSIWVVGEVIYLMQKRWYFPAALVVMLVPTFFILYVTILSPKIYYCEALEPSDGDNAWISREELTEMEKSWMDADFTATSMSYLQSIDCKRKTSDLSALYKMYLGDYKYTYIRK